MIRPRKSAGAGASPVRVRAAIDAGLTGEKAAVPDPAAAPLGTDAEASGARGDTEHVRIAPRAEVAHGRAPLLLLLLVILVAAGFAIVWIS